MHLTFFLCIPVLSAVCLTSAAQPGSDIVNFQQLRRSVFKIRVLSQEPDFRQPWSYRAQNRSHGTGFYIGDGRILTNAHVMAHAKFISIQRDGDPTPVQAKVEFIAHDSDLALLRPDHPGYLKGVHPVPFSESIPKLRSPVATVGFPMGGEQISVTKGIVSRIESRRYVHAWSSSHLMIQVDSAINSGNSGGPVIQNQKVIGVAFQSFSAAENTGYIIPVPVIRRFLRDIRDGTYDGHPEPGIRFSSAVNNNPASIMFHGLEGTSKGVKISHVHTWSSFHDHLQESDILLSINGHAIGVDGKISFAEERVSFLHIFDLSLPGDILNLAIKREGRSKSLKVPVITAPPHPVKGNMFSDRPPYLITGGLIFTVLSRNFLQSFGSHWYKSSPVLYKYLFYHGDLDPGFTHMKEYVVIASKLPHPVNQYIRLTESPVVTHLNDQRISSLSHLDQLIRKATGNHLKITLTGLSEPLILSREQIKTADRQIQKTYGIPRLSWLGPFQDGAIRVQ